MSKKIFFSLLFLVLLIAMPAMSAWASFTYTPMEKIPGFSTGTNFCTYITAVYNFGLWTIGICAMFMIMIGGYMYIMSAGNNASMGKAKGVIFDAVIGLMLALVAYLILFVINPDLVQIKSICGTGGGTGGGGGAGKTCTSFTYSAWDPATCKDSEKQTRKATGSPAGCTGTAPDKLEQTCSSATGGTCTSFTYSDWTTCKEGDKEQTRTAAGTPNGCTGTAPDALKQACTSTSTLGSLGADCDQYDSNFQSATSDKDTQCLLKAIAKTESGCNANQTCNEHNACGMMQIKSDYLSPSSDPQTNINKAASLLKTNQNQINAYAFSTISKGNSPGTNPPVNYQDGNTYYDGNDDLIASYNGGGGTLASEGKIGAFGASVACVNRSPYPTPMPAWQCPYVKAGSDEVETKGYKETRAYVQKVQTAQKTCLGN